LNTLANPNEEHENWVSIFGFKVGSLWIIEVKVIHNLYRFYFKCVHSILKYVHIQKNPLYVTVHDGCTHLTPYSVAEVKSLPEHPSNPCLDRINNLQTGYTISQIRQPQKWNPKP
jgi:hypothetical protein